MAENTGRLRVLNCSQHLLVQEMPISRVDVMRVLSDLFDDKHGVSTDLATLEQVKVLTFLADVIHRLVFVNNHSFETVFQGL